jgi:hypothetical protein
VSLLCGNHGTYNGDTVTWDTGSHEAARRTA